MKVLITEYLRIDLDTEQWECRCCNHVIGPARELYKEGTLVYHRDPREIHPPLLDEKKYAKTFAPDPKWCAILEYYCPGCGTLIETEYTVPGHPPVRDLELDIDALKAQWSKRKEEKVHIAAGDIPTPARPRHGQSH
ncbi:MAG: acetone carboxylase subunit gamma [Rhodocyclaceae bacterium]|jgi:acetone carboxylase gamma subunit|nr:acetone carboxylase subunit gamma [Rhodocyclaceae bacterium]